MRPLLACDLRLEVRAELREEAEHRPRRGVAERADRVAGDAVRDRSRAARCRRACRCPSATRRADLLEPAGALAARRALTARLVREELHDPPHRLRDVGLVVHHDDAARARHRAQRAAAAEVELLVRAAPSTGLMRSSVCSASNSHGTSSSSASSGGIDTPPGITALTLRPFQHAAADVVDHLA